MTRPIRNLQKEPASLTRLERTMMDALVDELAGTLPGLAAQAATLQPTRRTNTGFGLFTELTPRRPSDRPISGISGDFGTVHAMVGALKQPVAFRLRVFNGLLVGLLGDSYGQDTRQIDFTTVPFDCVFIVDAQGRSIEVQSRHVPANETERTYARLRPDRPREDRPKVQRSQATSSQHRPTVPQVPDPSRTNPTGDADTGSAIPVNLARALGGPLLGPLLAEAARASQQPRQVDGAPLSSAVPDRLSDGQLRAMIWGGAALLGLTIVLIFDIPFGAAFVLSAWLAATATGKKHFPKVRKWVDDAMARSGGS